MKLERDNFREEPQRRKREDSHEKGVILGAIFIVVGAALLLRNFNLLPEYIVQNFYNWKVLIMFIGALLVFDEKRRTGGVIMLFVGAFFFISQFFHFNFPFRQMMWPVIFVALGIYFILRKKNDSFFSDSSGLIDDDYLDETAIFGGGKKVVTSQNFRGGKITAIFGGYQVDLSEADLSMDKNVLMVDAVFGGLEIIVPEDWTVVVRMTPVLGGVGDKRTATSMHNQDATKVLVLKGTAIFGGVEIKNYPNRRYHA